MPCRDDRSDNSAYNKLALVEAVLCGTLTVIEKKQDVSVLFDKIDWQEAGVSRQDAETWWENHKEYDKQRKEAEQKEKNRQALVQSAASKLTDEEKKAIGINV